ncbi:MAG: phage tail sheath subtilisin-like domain-containing protein, partial [Gemmatimonadaceae bacterium]
EAARVEAALARAEQAPKVGHDFRVAVASFRLVLGELRAMVPATSALVLSRDPGAIPVPDGGRIIYAVLAVARGVAFALEVVPGAAVSAGAARAPSDAEIAAALLPAPPATPRWLRVADVLVERAGDAIRQTILPALRLQRCDDWADFLLAFGAPPDDGTILGAGVRAFFANGGRTCWVSVVRRPRFDDLAGLAEARLEMVGVQGASERSATGLERLLLVDDVMVVDIPDLYARHLAVDVETIPLPPRDMDACFRCCADVTPTAGDVQAASTRTLGEPLYDDADVLATQRALIDRCALEPWRVLLLLTAPLELDPTDGLYHGPTPRRIADWRVTLGAGLSGEESFVALYAPWLLAQERVDAPVVEMPPTPFAAGIIARRDLARGPHVAPANETLRGVVGLARPIDDEWHGALYEPPSNINLARAFPGYGVQLWGARTLSRDVWMRYVPIRRCLSAIERRVRAALQELVFEPNTPFLWMQVTQVALGVLMPLFEAGAMRGERPDEAFFIRCDASNNPPEEVEAGRLLCEVGVALAAPAEFIVFRVGRREGVIEVIE